MLLNSATARHFRDKIFKILYVRQYRISSILSQSVHNIQFIACYLVPDHQEAVKYSLKFTMLISTTARQTSNYMQIITYHVASFRTNHFQNTPCPAVSYFLHFVKNQIILCYIQGNCAIVMFCFVSIIL